MNQDFCFVYPLSQYSAILGAIPELPRIANHRKSGPKHGMG